MYTGRVNPQAREQSSGYGQKKEGSGRSFFRESFFLPKTSWIEAFGSASKVSRVSDLDTAMMQLEVPFFPPLDNHF